MMAKTKEGPRCVTDQHKLIGQRLRAARIQAGFSQAELGKELGVTFQQVQKYEKGFNRIDAHRMMAAAKALGVGSEYFLGAFKPTAASTAFAAVMATREGVQVIEAMTKMDEHQRQTLVMIAKRLPDSSVAR